MRQFFWFSPCLCLSAYVQSIATTESGPLDLVDISCDGKHTEKILYRYAGSRPFGVRVDTAYPQPLEYVARDSIHGELTQNIRINGAGKCFDLFVRLRWVCMCIQMIKLQLLL